MFRKTAFVTLRAWMPAAMLVLALVPAGVVAQPPAATAPLAPLDPFIGRWQGSSDGQPGRGAQEREYSRILNGKFVHATNRAVYPPQERNPKGETHEDVAIFSFDAARKQIVFRQFHVEGFVTEYVQQPPAADGKLVFVSESIENIPRDGARAKPIPSLALTSSRKCSNWQDRTSRSRSIHARA